MPDGGLPVPFLGWIDLSPDAVAEARALLADEEDEGVVDELGFSDFQTALADILFPATTTQTWRARYYLFVPAIYRRVEERIGSGAIPRELKKVDDAAREYQKALALELKKTGEARVVGSRHHHADPVLNASAQYWKGLRRLRIFRYDLGEKSWQHVLADGSRAPSDDEGSAWDSGMPVPSFPDSDKVCEPAALRITPEEAEYLEGRFRACSDANRPSLLDRLIANRLRSLAVFPWDIPSPPAWLGPLLGHLRCLSCMARGAYLQYWHLAAAAKASLEGGQAKGYGPAFGEWWHVANPLLATWDLRDFEEVLGRSGGGEAVVLPPGLLTFLREWTQRCRSSTDAASLLADGRAIELVRNREDAVKPFPRGRLKNPSLVDDSKLPTLEGPFHLAYRTAQGASIARDIVDGLQRRPS